MAFHQVWQAWAVDVFVPVVKRYSRAHSLRWAGGVGGWEAIFRNSGGAQGTIGWCEKAQCVPGSRFSLSCCANVFSWVSHEGFAVVTTDLNIVGFNVWIISMFYTQQTPNSRCRVLDSYNTVALQKQVTLSACVRFIFYYYFFFKSDISWL